MKLEAGRWYRTRDGRKAFVGFNHSVRKSSQWVGYIDGQESLYSWSYSGLYCSDIGSDFDLVAEWAKPKLRPWKFGEVPSGAWYARKIAPAQLSTIRTLHVEDNGVLWVSLGIGSELFSANCLLDDYQYSTDGGKTWLPCGVTE